MNTGPLPRTAATERLSRDRVLNLFGWIAVAWLGHYAVLTLVDGPRWAAIVLVPLTVFSAWSTWRTGLRLKAQREHPSSPTT